MARHVISTKFTQEDGALVGKILFIRNSRKIPEQKVFVIQNHVSVGWAF